MHILIEMSFAAEGSHRWLKQVLVSLVTAKIQGVGGGGYELVLAVVLLGAVLQVLVVVYSAHAVGRQQVFLIGDSNQRLALADG